VQITVIFLAHPDRFSPPVAVARARLQIEGKRVGGTVGRVGSPLAGEQQIAFFQQISTKSSASYVGERPRPFSNRGSWVKLGVKRWSLPGSWFSPGSVARPMMGVRGVTPRGGKRSDRAYAHSIHGLCAVVLTRRPGKDSASAGAELVWRIVR
jgi:hypothetical protein